MIKRKNHRGWNRMTSEYFSLGMNLPNLTNYTPIPSLKQDDIKKLAVGIIDITLIT